MLARLRPRLTFANVCSFLALLIALGTGSAYAANTVFSADIVDGQVKTADIGNSQVRSVDLRDADVGNPDLAADAVDSSKVLDESLTSSDLGNNSVGATEVADSTIDSGEIVNDSLFDTDLATGSVRGPEILDGGVGNADLGSNSVTASKVTAETLTTADIAGSATSGHVNLNGIPNGRCNQVDFSVGGAQPGDIAWVATGAPIQNGIVLYAQRVKSAGTVEVNACNFSGTSMTTLTNFPVRVVTIR